MKKIFGYLMTIVVSIATFMININTTVYAEAPHQFSLKVYDWNAMDNDWEGSGTGDELTANSDVEPGQVIMVSMYYVPGEVGVVGIQAGIKYDSSIVEPMYADGDVYVETDMSTTYQGGIWPAAGSTPNGRKSTNWHVLYNNYTAGDELTFIIEDSKLEKPLQTEGVIASVYFKVKETASAGGVINFSFDEEITKASEASGLKHPVTTSGINLNVFGTMSGSTALDTLTVSSRSQNYTLTPNFVSGNTSVKDYSVVVPNSVTSVDVAATAVDEYTTIASGTGNTTLNVGNNVINVISQAQNGTQDTYKVNVYRLNNNANLSSLSLTNDINIGTFDSDVISYTALVPYTTDVTTVNAELSDANASIESGTGSWSLTNYGSTINTKDVVVNAENCKSEYSTVPGNTCTKKTYQISITRTAPSQNANLSDLTIDGTTISGFSGTKYTYDLGTVPNETSSVNLNAIVEDTGKATITSSLGTKQLNVGDNTLTVNVEAEDGSTKEYIVTIRRLSNNSKLSSLTVTSNPAGTLNPAFDSDFYDSYTYTAPSTVSTVTINAVVEDTDNATIISGPGDYNIDNTNKVNVIVQAEDGTNSTYVVNLVRSKSSNNNLSSLSIDGYSLNETFSSDKTSYTANVSGGVERINVSAVVEDTGKATIVSGTGEHELNVGSNTIQIRVQAENGDTKDYSITVNRAKKTISSLTDLKVDNVSVQDFSETTTEYTLEKVPFNKTSVEISATKKDEDSTVTGIGTVNLNTGDNKLYVTVTAQDGITQTAYIINIEREKDSNAFLSDITVSGTTIENFDKNTFSYGITVENNVTSLSLVATPESSSASVTISDNSNFVTTDQNIVKVTVVAEDGTMNIYKIYVTRKKSDNNYLSSISLSSGKLNPTFDKLVNDYTVDVDRDVTTIDISATVEDATSTYTVAGPSSLSIGANNFKITVMSETGNDNIYNIVVNRNPSNNNYLSDLKVDGATVTDFNKNTETYTITVPSTKENITLSGLTEENHATTSGFGTFDLETGVNTFQVVVTAENGDEKTYTVVVNREKSDNSALSNLSVVQTTISPDFNPSTLAYTANVGYNVTNVDIVATVSDSKSTVTGDGNKELNTGDNVFEIVVTSENNTTTTYTLTVIRAKNNNANLSNITLSGGYSLDETFDPNDTEYNVSVPNTVESLVITAYKQDPNAVSVVGDGNISLNTGTNNINIVVTAEDGVTTKTYKLNIQRAKSNDATLKTLTVTGGTLNPTFSSDTTEYEVTVPYEIDKLTSTAESTSSAATVSYDEDLNLTVGTNTKTITVTAEDGTIKVYTLTITRQPSTNNFLNKLSVIDKNNKEYITEFVNTKLTYDINVENDITTVDIDGVVDDSSSTITGLGTKDIEIGNNSFNIVVESASGIERTYVINVFRKANSNNFLSKLEIEGQTISPEFKKDTLNYTASVDESVTKIKINAEAEVSTSSISGTGEFDLVTGDNTFNINVTAEDTSVKTYVIVVTKAASSNNYLSSLSVNPGELNPVFNKETLEYEMNVTNETNMITINAEKEDLAATITGDGIVSVNVGEQTYNIVVTAENNETRTYKIKVTRAASSVKDLKSLTIDGVSVENFDKDQLVYSLNVDNSTDKVLINAEVVDPTSGVSGIGEISLATGNNNIPVTVTAEDGSVKVYEINITRAKSNNNYLSSLTINEGDYTPEFDKETLTYNITVPYETTSLNISAVKEHEAATVEIENSADLQVGINSININVIAENSDVRTYVIKVTRQQQANNFLTSIVVTGNDGIKYSLSPTFDKNELNYSIELPGTINEVNISVVKQSDSLIVTGDGNVPITSLPQEQKIVVSTTDGLERTYTLRFTKGLSSNNNLGSLSVTPGTLDPSFNENELAYNVDLPEGTKEITINATKSEEVQTITGDGTKTLNPGQNTFKITVTAENGTFKVYTIIVNVDDANNDSKDNVLNSLSVDKGTLSPAFNKDVKLYTVNLEESEDNITITATGNNSITGTGLHSLEMGANVFEIVSTDNAGNENKYVVAVNRGSVESPYLKYLQIDGYKLNESFSKENYSYTSDIYNDISELNIIAVPEDKDSAIEISGNTSMIYGENNIVIKVTKANAILSTYNIKVNIGNNKITSSVHTVGDTYITTITELENSSKVKSEMDNPSEYLKIYDIDNNEILEDDIVGTGYTIKLVINGKVLDSKVLIVKGDTNNDGEVGVADVINLRLHILENTLLNTNEAIAADVNNDDDVGVADLIIIRSHILGTTNIYTREVE